MRRSYFHDYYKENEEELIKEARVNPRKYIQDKYHIGSVIYDLYFYGLYIDRRVKVRAPRVFIKKEPEETTFEYFNRKKKEIAKKFGKTEKYIQGFVGEGFTISEIENGKIVNGVLIVDHKVLYAPK